MNRRSKQLLTAGIQRLETARLICDNLQRYLEARYLAGYAAECALKALLYERTPARRHTELDGVVLHGRRAHNVEWLLEQLVTHTGEDIPAAVRRLISRIRLRWDVNLRYETGRGNLKETTELMVFCTELVEWVQRRLQ